MTPARLLTLCILFIIGCTAPPKPVASVPAPIIPPKPRPTYVLHLPGVAGKLPVDRYLVEGLYKGGLTPRAEIDDWTDGRAALNALSNSAENRKQAARIADKLTSIYRNDPATRVILIGHSGGTGAAIWTLEALPQDVKVDTVVLLACALSPKYDLSKALTHVQGKCYSMWSPLDNYVLGMGCRAFGTFDGEKTDAAGYIGFQAPATRDLKQYEKLIEFQWTSNLIPFDNDGTHIGWMSPYFARDWLAPLLLTGAPPAPRP